MKAIKVKDGYPDIKPGVPYEVDRIYEDGHIRLKNSKRLYKASSFRIFHNEKKVSCKEAYRLQQLENVKRRLGIK